jgi:hypothetical protein
VPGDHRGALDVTLAADDHAFPVPIGAVQLEGLRDAAAGRDEECDQSAVAEVRLGEVGDIRRGDPLDLISLQRLGEAFRELRQVDRDAEVALRPVLPGTEAEERPERDEPPVPRLGREGLRPTAASRHRHLKFPE